MTTGTSDVTLDAVVPGTLLPEDVFLELVDEVLVLVGREPLDRRGPQRSIITVRPADRVLQILAGAGSGKTEMLAGLRPSPTSGVVWVAGPDVLAG